MSTPRVKICPFLSQINLSKSKENQLFCLKSVCNLQQGGSLAPGFAILRSSRDKPGQSSPSLWLAQRVVIRQPWRGKKAQGCRLRSAFRSFDEESLRFVSHRQQLHWFSSAVLSDLCLFHVRLVIITHSYLEISVFTPPHVFFLSFIHTCSCVAWFLCVHLVVRSTSVHFMSFPSPQEQIWMLHDCDVKADAATVKRMKRCRWQAHRVFHANILLWHFCFMKGYMATI